MQNADIIIQKSDKGNSAIILDKKVYLEKTNEMLDKNKQFLKLSIREKNITSFWLIRKKRYVNLLRSYIKLTSLIRKHVINFVLLVLPLVFCVVWLKSLNSSQISVHDYQQGFTLTTEIKLIFQVYEQLYRFQHLAHVKRFFTNGFIELNTYIVAEHCHTKNLGKKDYE